MRMGRLGVAEMCEQAWWPLLNWSRVVSGGVRCVQPEEVSLALADASPPRDERGAGKARIGEGGLDSLELRWVQLVGEAG